MSRRNTSDIGLAIVLVIAIVTFIIIKLVYDEPTSQPTDETITTSIDPGNVDPTRLAQAGNASRDKERQNLNAGPIDDAFNYVKTMETYQPPTPEPEPEPTITPTTESAESSQNSNGSSDLPYLLQKIRSCESGPCEGLDQYWYGSYNPTGCEGYGCGGAYQLHARYASGWAAEAGYPGMSSDAQNWSPEVQDAVALYKFNQTGGALWCDWADYC